MRNSKPKGILNHTRSFGFFYRNVFGLFEAIEIHQNIMKRIIPLREHCRNDNVSCGYQVWMFGVQILCFQISWGHSKRLDTIQKQNFLDPTMKGAVGCSVDFMDSIDYQNTPPKVFKFSEDVGTYWMPAKGSARLHKRGRNDWMLYGCKGSNLHVRILYQMFSNIPRTPKVTYILVKRRPICIPSLTKLQTAPSQSTKKIPTHLPHPPSPLLPLPKSPESSPPKPHQTPPYHDDSKRQEPPPTNQGRSVLPYPSRRMRQERL